MLRRAADPLLAWWRARAILTQDGLFALTLAALAFAPGLVDTGTDLGQLPHRPMDLLGVALGLAQCLPLVLRRVAPLVSLVLIVAAFVADQVMAYTASFGSEGLLVVLYSTGAYVTKRWPPAAGIVGYIALCVWLHALGSPESLAEYLSFFFEVTLCWAAGRWMRSWRAGAEARRVHTAQLAVAEERARIARELHDVVTHHVAAMVVQSDATQFLLTGAPERAAEGLASIGDTGRRALTELRSLLDVLDGTCPAPTSPAAAIDELLARVRSTGQPVRFAQRGTRQPDTPDAVALAVHRVIQEALTNAVKHAPGRETMVQLAYTEDDITVQITNDRAPDRLPLAGLGGGRGLAGLRARVAAVGGDLIAEPGPDGGFFVVRARLPLRAGR